MDCNKEEARRAKGLAEKKMSSKDFMGARKIAMKAQQLFPELENISQMLMVCDVHCSADKKLFGNEMDWYGILQIEQTADEATIKRQYRKFALLLHPDKNQFSGAEAAFKLIGEAQRVLLDQGKRSTHDMKRRAFASKPVAPYRAPNPSRSSSFVAQNSFKSNTTSPFAGINLQPQKQAHSGFSGGHQTFWTECAFCKVRYQYYREIINKFLRCQNCQKSFIAYELNAQGVSQSAVPQQKGVQNQGANRVEVGYKRNISAENSRKESFLVNGCTSGVGVEKMSDKRKRKQVVDDESSDIGSSTSDSEEEVVVDKDGVFKTEQNGGSSGGQYVRRSNRRKQNVSYHENLSDDDTLVTPPKRGKGSTSSIVAEEETEVTLKEEPSKMNYQAGVKDQKEVKEKESDCFKETLPNGNSRTKKENGKEKEVEKDWMGSSDGVNGSISSSSKSPDPEVYAYPDPDFNDFDKDRNDEYFSVGQTWAIYDTVDAMPRFYAWIRRVLSPGFKLQITWLEPDPKDEMELEWVDGGLPYSCGMFKSGMSENTEDRLMFSHLVCSEKGSRRDTYKIYPRRGETWALFKKWDINWKSDPERNLMYEYEFVEIMSEYAEDVGICVAYLGKVRGFVSVFSRRVKEGMEMFQIPLGELLRFSHRVPSYKMTGEEREGVPNGSFELDPASLPTNLENIEVEVPNLKVNPSSTHSEGACLRSPSDKVNKMMGFEGSTSTCHANAKKTHLKAEESSGNVVEECSSSSASTPEIIEYPDPEFYNFDAEKSEAKFRIGQLWALYCDEDGLPKYYGQIEKIDSSPYFRLHVKWLISCLVSNDKIRRKSERVPICCGRFTTKGKSQIYTGTGSFSHQLTAEFMGKIMGKRNEYAIFPKKHEIWALYKNFSAAMTISDLEKCEYDIVEVLEENDLQTKVLVLDRVDGFNSVFKAQYKGGSAVTMEIYRVELLRFSHQIPAFKLTEERGGSLRGFWELDPAALPVHFSRMN